MEEAIARAWEQLAGRLTGPMWVRFLMQPTVAIVLAVRAGLRDAAANRKAYLWAIVSTASGRPALIRDGWKDMPAYYPLQSLIVMCLLAVVPYLLVRGPVGRAGKFFCVAALLLTAASTVSADPKYSVTVDVDKHFDFTMLKTYCWTVGWPAYDKATDHQIVAAVDRELSARGLTKLPGEPCDVVAKYGSLQRTDIDLKSKPFPRTNLRRQYAVGTVVVLLKEPRSRRELFRARVTAPLESEPSKRAAQVDAAIARIFEDYPVERVVRP